MPATVLSKFATIAKLIAALAAGGLVLAAMAFPAVGGVGVAARNTATMVHEVDADFSAEQPARVTSVLAADGSPIVYYYNQYRVPIALEQMGEWAPKAIVAIEDRRFYEHAGVDTQGTVRALIQNLLQGGVTQGGSSITQQLVKNTLLYQAETQKERDAAIEGSIGRKLREAKIAIELEKNLTKEQILERYLNLMNMGNGAYGIAAAAATFFGVSPDLLTVDQAALIAGLVQNPTKFNPYNNPTEAQKRRDLVLNAMAAEGMITVAERDEYIAKPLTLTGVPNPPRACSSAPNYGGFFCDYVWSYLTGNLGIPEKVLKEGGLTIQTTLNPQMQVHATNGILSASESLGRNPNIFGMADSRIAMMPVLSVKTGEVLALGINKVFGNDPDDPTQTSVNYPIVPGKGAGSTYKIFPAVVALSQGVGWKFELEAKAPYKSKISPGYEVENAGNYPDKMPLDMALYMSSNTYFVALEDHIGNMDPIVDAAYNMGLWATGDTALRDQYKRDQAASFTLGPELANPLRLATAYNTLANRGTRCDPVPIKAVLGADGQPLLNPATNQPYFTPGTNCTPGVVDKGVADTMNQILIKDVQPGYAGQTGRRAHIPGFQIAGKTGTAQSNTSYAFVGWTPDILASVLAYDSSLDPATANKALPAPSGGEGFGGGYPAMMWHDAMVNILPMVGDSSFPPANSKVAAGNVSVLGVNCLGQSPSNCNSMLEQAGFYGEDNGTPVDSAYPAGTVAAQDPPHGSSVSPGITVRYSLSTGNAPAGSPCNPGQDPASGCVPQAPAGSLCAPGQDPATGCLAPAPAGQPCVPGQDPASGCIATAPPAGQAPPPGGEEDTGNLAPGNTGPGNSGNGNSGNGNNGNGNGNNGG